MQAWKKFEHLVARIHELLDGTAYLVEHDVTIAEPSGAAHQIDVVLTPKNSYLGRVLVSCKSGERRVAIEHVRAWADIVQQTGSATGVIVSPAGFTADAIEAARTHTRRISLWVPRPLTRDDFGPDEHSPAGYIHSVGITGHLKYSVPRVETFVLDTEAASGRREGKTIEFTFSAETRDRYYLRDERDNIVGNLWDEYIVAAEALADSGTARVEHAEPRYLVLDGHRLRFKSLSMEIEVLEYVMHLEIDVTRDAFAYENAVTGEVKFVPLPPSVLQLERH